MLGLSLLVAGLQAGQAQLGPAHAAHEVCGSSSPRSAMPSHSSGPGRDTGPGYPRSAPHGPIYHHRMAHKNGCR